MRRLATPLHDRTPREVFREADSWAAVIDGLRHVKVAEDSMIRILAIGSPVPLIDAVQQRGFPGLRRTSIRGSVASYAYRRRYGRDERKSISGDFVVSASQHADVYLLAYVGGRSFLRHGITFLLDALYPRVARPFVTQNELHAPLSSTSHQARRPSDSRVFSEATIAF